MAIEEITLSAPCEPEQPTSVDSDKAQGQPGETGVARNARAYLQAARARDRVSCTQRRRQKRLEQFEQAVKTLVKSIATEASRDITDRSERLDVRTRIYSGVMVLAKAISHDQRAMLDRSRTSRRRSLTLAALGLLGIGMTLVANGWIQIPG
jgi:hypothetical protein